MVDTRIVVKILFMIAVKIFVKLIVKIVVNIVVSVVVKIVVEIVVKIVVKVFSKIGCQECVIIESPSASSVSIFGIFSVFLAHEVNKRTQYLILNVLV